MIQRWLSPAPCLCGTYSLVGVGRVQGKLPSSVVRETAVTIRHQSIKTKPVVGNVSLLWVLKEGSASGFSMWGDHKNHCGALSNHTCQDLTQLFWSDRSWVGLNIWILIISQVILCRGNYDLYVFYQTIRNYVYDINQTNFSQSSIFVSICWHPDTRNNAATMDSGHISTQCLHF